MVRNQLELLLQLPMALVVASLWAREIRMYQVKAGRVGGAWTVVKGLLWLIAALVADVALDVWLNPDFSIEGGSSPATPAGVAYGIAYSLSAFVVFGLLASFGMWRRGESAKRPPLILVIGAVPVLLVAGFVGLMGSWLAGRYLVAPVSFVIGDWLHFPACRQPGVLTAPYVALPSILLVVTATIALVPPFRRLAWRYAAFVLPAVWVGAVAAGTWGLYLELHDPWLCMPY